MGFLMGIFIIRLIIFVFCTILICPLVSYYVDLFLGFIVAIPALLGVFMTLWHLDILKRKEYCPFGEFIRRPFRKFLNGK